MPPLLKACPAKINLVLKILNKRPDGYHNLWTVFQKLSLADVLNASPHPRFKLTWEGNLDVAPEDNLIIKAAKEFEIQFKTNGGIWFHLKKSIPLGAGLGGGSSNAAAALLLCKDLLCPKAPMDQLKKLGAQLGADVPLFLEKGATLLGEGIGEKLRPIPSLPPFMVLIATPGCFISTREAFQNLPANRPPATEKIRNFWTSSPHPELHPQYFENDFELSAFENFPEIPKLKAKLQNTPALKVMLSGSGSSLFAIYAKTEDAQKALRTIKSDCRFACICRFQDGENTPYFVEK